MNVDDGGVSAVAADGVAVVDDGVHVTGVRREFLLGKLAAHRNGVVCNRW